MYLPFSFLLFIIRISAWKWYFCEIINWLKRICFPSVYVWYISKADRNTKEAMRCNSKWVSQNREGAFLDLKLEKNEKLGSMRWGLWIDSRMPKGGRSRAIHMVILKDMQNKKRLNSTWTVMQVKTAIQRKYTKLGLFYETGSMLLTKLVQPPIANINQFHGKVCNHANANGQAWSKKAFLNKLNYLD